MSLGFSSPISCALEDSFYNVAIMDAKALPNDFDSAVALIQTLRKQVEEQSVALELKEKLVTEQAHSVLEVKAVCDKLSEENAELNLKVEKLLRQLFGRKSERRVDGEGQLFLDLIDSETGEEATPEVVSAIEEAIREAEQTVADDQEKKKQQAQRPRKADRKLPEHLPRSERIVDLPEDQREGLKFIGYDEVERLIWKRAELRVEVVKYAKYAVPADPSNPDKRPGILSPERPTGLVEGDRFDVSIGVEVVAWKYFFHLPFYRQQDMFAGSGSRAQPQHALQHRNAGRVRLATVGRLSAKLPENGHLRGLRRHRSGADHTRGHA
jgi:transposase